MLLGIAPDSGPRRPPFLSHSPQGPEVQATCVAGAGTTFWLGARGGLWETTPQTKTLGGAGTGSLWGLQGTAPLPRTEGPGGPRRHSAPPWLRIPAPSGTRPAHQRVHSFPRLEPGGLQQNRPAGRGPAGPWNSEERAVPRVVHTQQLRGSPAWGPRQPGSCSYTVTPTAWAGALTATLSQGGLCTERPAPGMSLCLRGSGASRERAGQVVAERGRQKLVVQEADAFLLRAPGLARPRHGLAVWRATCFPSGPLRGRG